MQPQLKRDEDQAREDAFCQQLLRLGAKLWDSMIRFQVVEALRSGRDPAYTRGRPRGTQPDPTKREKRWVSVGWPAAGGLWVAEFETADQGTTIQEEEDLPPEDLGLAKVWLARTMEERCQLLRDEFKGRYYSDVEEYQGYAFLNAWDWKHTGECGALISAEETCAEWRANLDRING